MTPCGWLAFVLGLSLAEPLTLIVTEEQKIETGDNTDCDIQLSACKAIVLLAEHAGQGV